jgi:hypothetical protein
MARNGGVDVGICQWQKGAVRIGASQEKYVAGGPGIDLGSQLQSVIEDPTDWVRQTTTDSDPYCDT